MSNKNCRLCDIWNGKYINEQFDVPFMRNDDYLAMASIGAFIEGWSLVVPRTHTFSMRTYYSDPDFADFVESVISHIKNVFHKSVLVFEHGANTCTSETSCGTHHAHLHIVPYDGSIIEDIYEDRDWTRVGLGDIEDTVQQNEYLLYSDNFNSFKTATFNIHILKKEESQYFRRLLGTKIGIDDYSYKTAPYIEKTIHGATLLKGE